MNTSKSSLLYINSVIHASADKLHIGQIKFISTEELTQLLVTFRHIQVKSEFKNDFKSMCYTLLLLAITINQFPRLSLFQH